MHASLGPYPTFVPLILLVLPAPFTMQRWPPPQVSEEIISRSLHQRPPGKGEMQQTSMQTEFLQIKLDPEEMPVNWPARKKWSSTIVVVLMTATITFCSSIHTTAIGGVAISFECSETVATLGVSTFLIGFATGPMLFAPLSEVWGRSVVFRITLFLFFCFNLGCALAPNIAALLILRFLCGFFGSPTGTPSAISLAQILGKKT